MAPFGQGRRTRLLPLALVVALLWAGCGAYFNTYYNASKAYKKGESTLKGASGAKGARSSYDDCLKISSKLLQFYPDSRWVDDTVLLIGQCYYRLDQHHRALRKFDELEASYPDSPLLPRARIWRARSYLALGRGDDCLADLAVMELAALERKDRMEALRVYAELYRSEDSRGRLLETLERSLDDARRREKGDLHADMAATLELEGRWEEALRHYNAVRRYRPAHALLFRSWLGTLDNSLRLGRLDQVEKRLPKLRKDERFYEERHALDLREGWLWESRGRLSEARSAWATILRDFPRTESSAAAAHSLGRSYLYVDDQLDSARTYLKRTSSEKQGSSWADSSARDLALLETLDKSRREIQRLDGLWRQRRASLHPDSARLALARGYLPSLHARRDSLRTDSLRKAQVADTSLLAVDSLKVRTQAGAPPASAPVDSLASAGKAREARKGGRTRLFDFQRKEREAARADSLRQAQSADSLRQALEQALLQREDSLLVAAVLDTLSRRPVIDSLRLGSEADSLARLAFDQRFYLCEVFIKRLGRSQQADSLLRLLKVEEAATGDQLARAHYAAARLRLDAFADSSGRRDLVQVVDRWPMSPVANSARDALGLPRMLSAEDSAAVLVDAAESRWRAGEDPLGSMAAYGEVAERYASLPQAATALLAAGSIAWDELENPALATPSYRRFLKDFPAHPMADAVRRRLGQAVEEKDSGGKKPADRKAGEEVELQQVATTQAVTDDAGAFMDPDQSKPLGTRLQEFRQRFKDLGRLRVEQILE